MSDEVPYRAEYAKSDRSKCQTCEEFIIKQSLRLAAIVPVSLSSKKKSSVHNRTIPRWYHLKCFFEKQRPKSTAHIACFDEICPEDQDKIKKIIESLNAPSVSGKGDFRVEYAKSNRSTCKGCNEKIIKGEIRIAKKDYESVKARRFGALDRWNHLGCFAKLRADLGYYGSGDELPGAKELSEEDRNSLKAALPKMTQGDIPSPEKIKEEPEDAEDAKLMKKQNEELYAIKNQISSSVKEEEDGSKIQGKDKLVKISGLENEIGDLNIL